MDPNGRQATRLRQQIESNHNHQTGTGHPIKVMGCMKDLNSNHVTDSMFIGTLSMCSLRVLCVCSLKSCFVLFSFLVFNPLFLFLTMFDFPFPFDFFFFFSSSTRQASLEVICHTTG